MIHFRKPALADAEELARVHVRCWQETYKDILDAGFLRELSVEQRADLWRKVIADKDRFALAVESEGEKIGFVMSGPASAACRQWADGEVHALYLLQAFHGRGFGRRLMTAALNHWRDRGGEQVVAMVFSENHQARRFYALLGGREAGQMGFSLSGRELVETSYVFELGKV